MIEQKLKELLTDKYGDFTAIRLTGGYTNETFLLKGTSPLLVVKIANSFNVDIQNEIYSLRSIEETGVAPKVIDFIETPLGQITVMEYREGKNGQTIIDRGNLETNKEIYKALGKELSTRIHSQKYKSISNGIKEFNIEELNFNLDFVPGILIQHSKQILKELNDNKEEWVLTHGDFGVHNVLCTVNNSLTVIDWEWAEWANPLIDIAWVYWFTKLHYPEQSNTLNPLFIEEYKKHTSVHLSTEKLKAYCLYKVWKILNKIGNAPREVQLEWVRRLRWTIETDII